MPGPTASWSSAGEVQWRLEVLHQVRPVVRSLAPELALDCCRTCRRWSWRSWCTPSVDCGSTLGACGAASGGLPIFAASAAPDCGRLGARADAELAQARRDVVSDGLLGEVQRGRDLGVSPPGGDEREHLPFPRGQPVGIGLVARFAARAALAGRGPRARGRTRGLRRPRPSAEHRDRLARRLVVARATRPARRRTGSRAPARRRPRSRQSPASSSANGSGGTSGTAAEPQRAAQTASSPAIHGARRTAPSASPASASRRAASSPSSHAISARARRTSHSRNPSRAPSTAASAPSSSSRAPARPRRARRAQRAHRSASLRRRSRAATPASSASASSRRPRSRSERAYDCVTSSSGLEEQPLLEERAAGRVQLVRLRRGRGGSRDDEPVDIAADLLVVERRSERELAARRSGDGPGASITYCSISACSGNARENHEACSPPPPHSS